MKRRNKTQVIEDSFSDLSLDEQGKLLVILSAIHRQQARAGAALHDIAKQSGQMNLADGAK